MGATRRRTTSRRRSPATGKAPSVALLLWPFGAGALAVLLAALHSALGSPFGARFAGELWDACKQAGIFLIAYGPLAGYAHRANKNALAGGPDAGYALGSGDGTDDGAQVGRPGGARGGQARGEEDDDRDYHDDRRRRP